MEIRLIIDKKSSVVEIAGACDDVLTIGNEQAGVKHAGTVLVELDAGVEVALPVKLRGPAGNLRVDVRAGDDDRDLDASGGGSEKGPTIANAGDEVGLLEEKGPLGVCDGAVKVSAEGIFTIGPRGVGDDGCAVGAILCLGLRKKSGARERGVRHFLPVFCEGPLELPDGRPGEAVHGIPPGRRAGACPVMGDSGAAGEGDLAVDDEDLAVGAVIGPPWAEDGERVVEVNFGAGVAKGREMRF